MRLLQILIFSCLVFITSSVQKINASEDYPSVYKPLISELYLHFPYYVEYLFHSSQFTSKLTPDEHHKLQQLRRYFAELRTLPELLFIQNREEFILEPAGKERMAKTTAEMYSSIDFNQGLLAEPQVKIDIPFVIQILFHEFGHKLNDEQYQADIDGLATKAALFFKAYTKQIMIAKGTQLHALSLPIDWFQWQQKDRNITSFRHRPNSAVFLQTQDGHFKSFTSAIFNKVASGAGVYWPAGETAYQAFTDSQLCIYGWDVSTTGKISAYVKEQKRLQPQQGRIWSFDQEVYGKSVGGDYQLAFSISDDQKHLNLQTEPLSSLDLAGAIETSLELQQSGDYKLILPEFKGNDPILLRLTTEDGPVFISAENNLGEDHPLTFRVKVNPKRAVGFIEVHSIAKPDGKLQFLDKSYWLVNGSPNVAREKSDVRARFMQLQINTKWKKLNSEKGLLRTRWGENAFRIQLEKFKKIRHIRFVWSMSRKHFQSYLLKTPFINNPFEQRYVESRGFHGAEHAIENDTYEEVFTERDIQQDDRTVTVPLSFYPRHIATTQTSHYMMNMNMFGSHTFPVTTKKILAEDLGDRQLMDVLVTDEDLQTTSLLRDGESFSFLVNNSGLSECEEYLLRQRQYYDFSQVKVKGRR